MKERGSKKVPTSLRLNAVLHARLKAFADIKARPVSEVIDRAVEEFLDRHAPEQQKAKSGK